MKAECKECPHFYWCYSDDTEFNKEEPTNDKFCLHKDNDCSICNSE